MDVTILNRRVAVPGGNSRRRLWPCSRDECNAPLLPSASVPAGNKRSRVWTHGSDKNAFIARHHLRAMGLTTRAISAQPLIGIANTWSELTPCNAHLRELAHAVRRGIQSNGGTAIEFPMLSLGEPLMRPTSMMFRNLAAMELEELLRANPLDAVVVLTGCDKTTPAALMGMASTDLPAILLTGGPMLNGQFRGRTVGSGTDVWRMLDGLRSGTVTSEEFTDFESCLNRSSGHCMTMGTASSMACIAEAMGMQLPGAAALPAVDSRRYVLAEETGARAVELAREGLRPSDIMTEASLHNGIKVLAALGGSTNVVLHLLAIAGRLRLPLSLDDFDRLAREIPLLVDLMPSGNLLMEDFAYAGGVPGLLKQMASAIDTSVTTVSGATLREVVSNVTWVDTKVIRSWDDPVQPPGSGTAVLKGTLAPNGAVIKTSAANPDLLTHTGRAIVFDSLRDYLMVVDDEDFPVDAKAVLVIRNCGPRGYPGMPEVGNFPLPRKLLVAGVRDMVRISDARMSGTAYGTAVLHVAPEAAIGGPLALVRTGDVVRLDVPSRRLDLLVPEAELNARRAAWRSGIAVPTRGWARLYFEHVQQADLGVDLDFLVGGSGDSPPSPAF